MTRQILLFSLLPAFAADVQSTLPRDPQCVVTVNMPERSCGQTGGYGADDNYVKKNEFLALQTMVKVLQQELATTKAAVVNRTGFKQAPVVASTRPIHPVYAPFLVRLKFGIWHSFDMKQST